MHTYYIDMEGNRDGPHDLVTIMRRIHSQKIGPDTLIYIDGAADAVAAKSIPEVALFFNRQDSGGNIVEDTRQVPTLQSLLTRAWEFTMEHNVITVYAGGMLLLTVLLAAELVDVLGWKIGGLLSWALFVIFHNLYLISVLRLYRGQTFSSDYFNRVFAPLLPSLLLSGLVLALMMAGGLLLLIVPCILVAIFYVFVPYLILDHSYNVVEAMEASRMLLQKRNRRYLDIVSTIVVLHLVCLLLIVPLPLTLPMFAVMLAELHEELSAS